MARPNLGNTRKSYQLPGSAVAKATEFAALNGASLGSLITEWAEAFVEHGSDYVPDPPAVVQAWGDPEVFAAAEQRAREEFGVGFREILMFEISEIDKL